MSEAEKEPQQYAFSAHEFRDLSPKQKGGYTFSMQVSKGKSLTNIKTSTIAKELLEVLQQSKKATELTGLATYELTLDRQFVLKVSKKVEAVVEDPAAVKAWHSLLTIIS